MKKTNNGGGGSKRLSSIEAAPRFDENFVRLASCTEDGNDHLKALVAKSWQGMRQGFSPTLCKEGVGGTYFMRDAYNRTIGVFKPQDEEMGCLNNPKGFTPGSLSYNKTRRGVLEGEAAYRECAAYILDHEHFSGVPATDLVVCNHPSFNNSPIGTPSEENLKIGSFQEFKEHDFDAEDISPTRASRFPVNEVHKIAILDIRLFNTDRHGGNILIRKLSKSPRRYNNKYRRGDSDGEEDEKIQHNYDSDADENGLVDSQMQFRMEMGSDPGSDYDDDDERRPYHDDDADASYELIPIDHGYTLPHTISGLQNSWFEWLNWPQARQPFSPETKAYISRLDAEKDIALLKQKFGDWIRPECYKVLRITTLWLKIGAEMGLTPKDIGLMMCSMTGEEPTQLEKICWEAEESAEKQRDGEKNMNDLFFENLALVMRRVAIERKKDIERWV